MKKRGDSATAACRIDVYEERVTAPTVRTPVKRQVASHEPSDVPIDEVVEAEGLSHSYPEVAHVLDARVIDDLKTSGGLSDTRPPRRQGAWRDRRLDHLEASTSRSSIRAAIHSRTSDSTQ